MVKAVRYEGADGTQVVVTERHLIIGRDLLKIVDKRVSRQHCMIRIDKGTDEISVYIKSLHQTNPTFYRKKGATCDSALNKDESVLLVTGDKFRLTPDGDWLVVEDQEEIAQAGAREEDTQELDDQREVADSVTENSQAPISTNEVATKRGHECVDASETEGCKRSRVEEDDAMPSTSAVTTAPSSLSHVAGEVPPSINIKPDPDSSVSNSTSVTSAVTIKPDPDGANLASTSTTPMNIKPDPDGSGVTPAVPVLNPADSVAIRPSCDFGIRCYRGGKDHRSSFAHPGDPDYRRPYFPPAPLNAPLCPFGARCYRRNPTHFQEYQHPDPSAGTLGRPRRRVAAPANSNDFYDYSDEDEYDQPDFDWSSSDEYNPGLYDEDVDDSVSEDEGLGCVDSGTQDL